jgi:membrane fusion protein (multidrug efflux system)
MECFRRRGFLEMLSNVLRAALVCTAGAFLAACNEAETSPTVEIPIDVGIVTMQPTARPYIRELPGRISPTRIADVRARVSGIVVERTFQQGADVQAGDVLYRIDPKPFEVELQASEAALAKAQAVLEQAAQQAKRVEQLIAGRVATQVQHETSIANLRQAEADVAAREADVQRSRLNLEYATVRSPINGRVGRALVTEGALVGQGEATHMATVQHLDTVYADFTQSISEVNELRRQFETGDLEAVAPETTKVRLVLDDGSIYPHPGRLLFTEATVDPTTGQVTLRGAFPNPRGELLPGMYVRVQIEQGIDSDALAVPQQAIQRNDAGQSAVYVVTDDGRAIVQPVRTGRVVDNHWLIQEGLKPGDRVVVDGFQKFVPGSRVNPVQWRPDRNTASDEPETRVRRVDYSSVTVTR